MPNQGKNVSFQYGTQNNYDNLTTKDSNTFYITSDTKRIYLGEDLYNMPNCVIPVNYYEYNNGESYLLYQGFCEYGADFIATDIYPTEIGKKLMGWDTTPNGSPHFLFENVTSPMSLYPIVQDDPSMCVVTYYSQDGNTILGTEYVNKNENAQGLATNPTKATDSFYKYTFLGWNNVPNSTSINSNILNNITQNLDLYVVFDKVIKDDTISDSWEEIIANCNNGTYSSKYQIGDLKTIDVGSEGPVQMQIVAIDEDVLAADNSKTAPITWVSKQLLPTGKKMAETANNIADWRESELRTYLRTTVFGLLPQIVQESILEVTKTSCLYYYSNNSYISNMTSSETIWIPSARELGDSSAAESSGVTYTILNTDSYSSNTSKAVFGNNSNEVWWTRSASTRNGYGSSAYTFRTVNTVGQLDNYMSGHVGNVFTNKFPLCFCLGGIQYTINYYSQDGQTLLYSEKVASGSNGTYSGTPKKESTAQYNYTFVGWNTSTGQTTATANVLDNITADKSVYAAFSEVFKTDTISDSWEEIIANCNNGTYSSKYQIGDLKTIDIGTEGPVQMQIVAIDTDVLADSNNTAPITWISKQVLNTSRRMNPSDAGEGWEKTEMRSYLKEIIKPLIPETVRNAIKPVKKYSRIFSSVSGSPVSNVLTTEDVWIPSCQEILGNHSSESSGVYYSSAFPDSTSRIKSKAGSSAAWWWLRSAYQAENFFVVGPDGSEGWVTVHNTGGVTLGFCT